MQTTKAHYEYYCREVKRWSQAYGVTGWQVYFEWHDIEPSYARTTYNCHDNAATFHFPTDWDAEHKPLNRPSISLAARHEVLHLLLAPFWTVACKRFPTQDQIDVIEEQVVGKIEAIIDL